MHASALVGPGLQKRALISLAMPIMSVFIAYILCQSVLCEVFLMLRTVLCRSNLGADFHSIPIRVRI